MLIQSQVITVPATTGTQIYKTQFDSDRNFGYVTGIACMAVSGSLSQNIELEFKDDNGTLFTFSPVANWVKDTTHAHKDLTALFRSCNFTSKGRNIYCNVKATDTDEAVKFVVYYRQENTTKEICEYNFETYEVDFANFPAAHNITLPTQFKRVVGIAAYTTSSEAEKVFVRVENTQKNLVDNIQLSALNVTSATLYDQAFFPVDFAADGQEVKIYASAVDTVSGTVNAKICFLLRN